MTAEEAAFLMMSGGSSYTNEGKILTANGEYIPPDNVRWDRVTVDVPKSGNIIDRITSLPVVKSGNLGSKYRFRIQYGSVDGGVRVAINSYFETNKGGVRKYYPGYRNEITTAWFVIYSNAENKPVCAYAINSPPDYGQYISDNNFYSKCYEYSTRATNGSPIDTNKLQEFEDWLYCLHTARLTEVKSGGLIKDGYSTFYERFTFNFTVVNEYYVAYLDESGDIYQTAPPGTVLRTDVSTYSVGITSYLPLSSFRPQSQIFSNLSCDELEKEFVNLTYSLNEI